MADAHKNFAYSTIATAPSPAVSGTSLVVASGQGTLFPTPPFNATVWPSNAQPTSFNAEIVRVTAISTDVIVNADINSAAGIVDTKLATISTAGKVSNSATTATDANTANAIVARDASGNFSAGTITAALTGAASSNVLKAGDTMTGNLIMDDQKEIRFREGSGGGTNYAAIRAPSTLAADYTLTLPADDGAANQFLQTDGSGNLTWATASGGSGLAGTAPGSTINTNYTVVSGDNGRTLNIDCSGGPIDVTLPSPSSGFKVTIKDYKGNSNTNNIVIKRAGSELIDNTASDDSITTAFGATSLVSDGTDWYRIASFSGVTPTSLSRALFAGGTTGADSNVIDFISITTLGNASDFGDLTQARRHISGCSSSTRGVFGGGQTGAVVNTIDYVTIASMGNATDFGDLSVTRGYTASFSNETRGCWAGGFDSSNQNVIDYITIATTGNATDFGDLTEARRYCAGLSSTTRGVVGGGVTGTFVDTMDYVTIASTGNATDFGNLTQSRGELAACSSGTRGVFAGGQNGSVQNTIDYITIASTGDATDFGDLTLARATPSGTSSKIRGVFGGGTDNGVTYYNTIDYITIATTGNATDFGDLTVARTSLASCSNVHGGLA
jgi:hypothetical protein